MDKTEMEKEERPSSIHGHLHWPKPNWTRYQMIFPKQKQTGWLSRSGAHWTQLAYVSLYRNSITLGSSRGAFNPPLIPLCHLVFPPPFLSLCLMSTCCTSIQMTSSTVWRVLKGELRGHERSGINPCPFRLKRKGW